MFGETVSTGRDGSLCTQSLKQFHKEFPAGQSLQIAMWREREKKSPPKIEPWGPGPATHSSYPHAPSTIPTPTAPTSPLQTTAMFPVPDVEADVVAAGADDAVVLEDPVVAEDPSLEATVALLDVPSARSVAQSDSYAAESKTKEENQIRLKDNSRESMEKGGRETHS